MTTPSTASGQSAHPAPSRDEAIEQAAAIYAAARERLHLGQVATAQEGTP